MDKIYFVAEVFNTLNYKKYVVQIIFKRIFEFSDNTKTNKQ